MSPIQTFVLQLNIAESSLLPLQLIESGAYELCASISKACLPTRGQIARSRTLDHTSPTGHCQILPAASWAHGSVYICHIIHPLTPALFPELALESLPPTETV